MTKDKLISAVKSMAELPDENKVSIKGKLYAEVHTRVQAFREAFGVDGRIISKVHTADEERVLTETRVSIYADGSWREIGNDFAEEFRGSGMVNKTSAVENCLTSSIGRALSACGLSGGNYASFEEVDHAINEKAEAPKKTAKKKANGKAKVKKEESERNEDWASVFADGFVKTSKMFKTKKEISDFYKANIEKMSHIKDNFPHIKEHIDNHIKSYVEELEEK
tara:strand:- start:3268 stop:3936 length:669 start_codon:yes stop_codon:yes gene_type:complete